MENERNQIHDSRKMADMEIKDLEAQISDYEAEIKKFKDSMNVLSSEKQQLEDEKAEKVKASTFIEMTLQEMEKNSENNDKAS